MDMTKTQIKICGITCEADLREAAVAGADFIGVVVDVPRSPRSQNIDVACGLVAIACSVGVYPVAVTVNLSLDQLAILTSSTSVYALQLHGNEPPDFIRELCDVVQCRVWKALPLPSSEVLEGECLAVDRLLQSAMSYVDAGVDAIILDTVIHGQMGGTGIIGNWPLASELVARLPVPCILSGGIDTENVCTAITTVKPWCVDSSSGLERTPGEKDHVEMRRFVATARNVDR